MVDGDSAPLLAFLDAVLLVLPDRRCDASFLVTFATR